MATVNLATIFCLILVFIEVNCQTHVCDKSLLQQVDVKFARTAITIEKENEVIGELMNKSQNLETGKELYQALENLHKTNNFRVGWYRAASFKSANPKDKICDAARTFLSEAKIFSTMINGVFLKLYTVGNMTIDNFSRIKSSFLNLLAVYIGVLDQILYMVGNEVWQQFTLFKKHPRKGPEALHNIANTYTTSNQQLRDEVSEDLSKLQKAVESSLGLSSHSSRAPGSSGPGVSGPDSSVPGSSVNKSPESSPEHSPKHSPESSPKRSPESPPESSPESFPSGRSLAKSSPEHSPESSPESSSESSPEASPVSSHESSPDSSPDSIDLRSSPESTPDSSSESSDYMSPDLYTDFFPEHSRDSSIDFDTEEDSFRDSDEDTYSIFFPAYRRRSRHNSETD